MAEAETSAEALNAQGNARKAAGDLQGAIDCYRRALEASPGFAAAHFNLGLALRESGRAREAAHCFERVAELEPSDGEAWMQLSICLSEGGKPAQAREALERAAALLPDAEAAQIHDDIGLALLDEERGPEAAAHFEQALRRGGDQADRLNNLGVAWRVAGQAGKARAAFERALARDPGLLQARLNLGDGLMEQGDWEAAARCFAEGMRAHPRFATFVDRLLFAMQQMCDWSRFDELCEKRLAALREDPDRVSPPFSLLSIPSSAAEQKACAVRLARRLERQAQAEDAARAPAVARPAGKRPSGERIRIGYLSSDFYQHVTAYVLVEVLELHDRQAFEIFAYSFARDDRSALRARIAAAVDHFVDLRGLSDREAAERIRADGIDILLDVNGYTQSGRSGIAAWRAAPVQVNYLGYPGTLGAPYIDYAVGDRFIFTPEIAREFSEQPVYMPGCYAPNDRRRTIAPLRSRAQLGLPEDALVLCCFNQSFKILPQVFAAWMRILHAVPLGVLWLLEANAAATRNVRAAAVQSGIDPGRLIVAPRVPSAEYLARLPAADLFLDTWPYNAHTTAADALWMGVPVLTYAGDTFASRVGGSMVTAAGVPELVADSLQDYERAAIRLAGSPDERAWLCARLAEGRDRTPLFDTPAYTRALEAAFREMHQLERKGHSPRPLAPQVS